METTQVSISARMDTASRYSGSCVETKNKRQLYSTVGLTLRNILSSEKNPDALLGVPPVQFHVRKVRNRRKQSKS